MDPITQQTTLASAGGKQDPVYVDDVFNTRLYDGTSSAQSISTGIDLTTKGMIWSKGRSGSGFNTGFHTHTFLDSERNNYGKYIRSTSADGEAAQTTLTVDSDGFDLTSVPTTYSMFNTVNTKFVAWNFVAQKGFFDVVVYNGNNTTGRNIPHNLGCVPGMIIIKCTSHQEDWCVYHRSLGATKNLRLSEPDVARTETNKWNDTEPTATHFTVGENGLVNYTTQSDPRTYVAYLFAHDDTSFGTDGDEAIIKCGTYSGNSGSQQIDVGFEPQFVMLKATNASEDWLMFDSLRGAAWNGSNQPMLKPNRNYIEDSYYRGYIHSNGFGWDNEAGATINANGTDYVYMAIRRPNKPPTAATDVFAIDTGNGSSTIPTYDSGFPVDFALRMSNPNGGNNPRLNTRMLGVEELLTSSDNGMTSDSASEFDSNVGWSKSYDNTSYSWMFKRAPGFADVVRYTGNTTDNRQINHSLGVAPELVITKDLESQESWGVWSKHADYASNENRHGFLGSSNGTTTWGTYGGFPTAPDQSSYFTSSYFTVKTSIFSNANNHKMIAYLFASLPGISKVGRYTGNGTSKVIDCGFDAGARFVLIRCMTVSNDWRLFDTVRGINASGNDPVIPLNTNAGQNNYVDWLRPNSSGFEVNTSNDNVNGNNAEYLFLAIA